MLPEKGFEFDEVAAGFILYVNNAPRIDSATSFPTTDVYASCTSNHGIRNGFLRIGNLIQFLSRLIITFCSCLTHFQFLIFLQVLFVLVTVTVWYPEYCDAIVIQLFENFLLEIGEFCGRQ